MVDVVAVRDELADGLLEATDVRTYKGAVDSPTVPCFVVPLPEVAYHSDFGGDVVLTFAVRYLVGRTNEKAAQVRLGAAMSTGSDTSVVDALEGLTLTEANSVVVASATRVGVYSYGEIDYLGVEFVTEVI